MPRERSGGEMRAGTGAIALLGLAMVLSGCGSSTILSSSPLDLFNTSSKATTGKPSAGTDTAAAAPESTDIECPSVEVRTGAATLIIGSKPGAEEPSALDLRYQGTILRTARECHVNAGIMTMKVGIEGRIITGPAGGPGTVDVPLRIAVVHEGPSPKTIVSKLAVVPATITSAVDRVSFVHVESDIAFPMPVPAANIAGYVVYVGFDPNAAPEKKRPAPKRKPAAKPKPA